MNFPTTGTLAEARFILSERDTPLMHKAGKKDSVGLLGKCKKAGKGAWKEFTGYRKPKWK